MGVKGGRCVGLTKLPPSCANCLETWEPQTPGTLTASPGVYRDCFAFYQLNVVCRINYDGFVGVKYEFRNERPGQIDFLAFLIETNTLPPHPPPLWTEMTAGRKWGGIFLEEAGSS